MIPSQRHLFDIPADVAYLNCAYMSPLMKPVVDAGVAGMQVKAQPWNITPQDFFTDSERVRAAFARLVSADDAGDVAIIPAASYGIATAARNIPIAKGQKILVLAEQFPSHVYEWRELAKATGAEIVTIDRDETGGFTGPVLGAIDHNVALAALPHCHWTDGTVLDLVAIGARLRDEGAALVIDGTQSLGALPFSVQEIQPDFLIAGGYKWLMGPYSLGYMYVAPKWQNGRPLENNWIARKRSEDFSRLIDYQDEFQPGARRYDMGERSNPALLPAGLAALDQLNAWTPQAIQATLIDRNRQIVAAAAELGLSAPAEESRAGHFLGLRFPGAAPENLVERLAAEQVYVSVRGASMRVTPHVYNNDNDVDKLISALKMVM